MADTTCIDIARHYAVEDLPAAKLVGSRLQGILERLYRGNKLSPRALNFLQSQGLNALFLLASDRIGLEAFREAGMAERAVRTEAAAAAEAEARERNAIRDEEARRSADRDEAARLARERDPDFIAVVNAHKLQERFGLTVSEQADIATLMDIVRSIDSGKRLSEVEYAWLSSTGKKYFTQALQKAYHRLEAQYFASQFAKTRDPWEAVNASKHYRKCDEAIAAASMLGTIALDSFAPAKLRSALCTTHGGVMRDLGHRAEAIRLGLEAHGHAPRDFRPCTLLGAVHMESGRYEDGRSWYAKAVENGATLDDVDQDLRRVFFSCDKAKQAAMRNFLLADDPVRYRWARSEPPRNKHS